MAYCYVSKGETSTGIILNDPDQLYVLDGGVANETTVNEYSIMEVSSGGTANSTTVNKYGGIYVSSGGAANITVVRDAYFNLSGTANSTTIADGGYLYVYPGATASKVAIDFGYLSVYRGGTATEIEWTPCVGSVWVENGAHVTFASAYTGVYYGSGGKVIESAATMDDRKLTDKLQSMYVMSDGIANRTEVYFSGCQHVCSGGTVNSTWVRGYGNLLVSSGGTASDTTLSEYSRMAVFSGGAANNTVVNSGTFNLFGGVADGVTLNVGGNLIVDDGGAAGHVTVNASGCLTVSGGSAKVTDWTPGVGRVVVYGGGQVTFAGEYTGVYYGDGNDLISSAAEMNDIELYANYYELYVMNGGKANYTAVDGGYMAVFSGGAADSTTVTSGGKLFVNNGGKAEHATIGKWGEVYVNSGGTANSTTVNLYGSFTVFGSADDVTVNNSGTVWVQNGGKATNATVSSGTMYVSGATVDKTIVNDRGSLYIDETGKADHTTVGGSMYVYGEAENTTISGGEVHISSGGKMTGTVVTRETDGNWGSATVSSGGTAVKTTVDPNGVFAIYDGGSADVVTVAAGGWIYITEGATATNITAADGAKLSLTVAPGTYAQGTYNGSAFEMKDGILSGYTARYDDGVLYVVSGGVATDITVKDGATVFVAEDGVLDGITLTGGYLAVYEGGKVTGKMSFDDGANERIWTYNGAIVDFDLTRTAPGDEVLVNKLAAIKGNGKYTLTVDGTEKNGVYCLADGASDYNKTITVVNTSGESQGSLWVGGDTLIFGDHSYKLVRDGSILSVTVSDPLPPNGPDESDNDTLYINKTTVNEAVTTAYGTYLTAPGDPVYLDQFGKIEKTVEDEKGVKHTFYNHVEKKVDDKIDVIDYAKIVLEHGAKLSFHVSATAAATFTVYSLTEKKGKYTLKKLQTLKLADKDKDGVFTADSSKPVSLSVSGAYYVSMKYTDKRKDVTDAYYNVTLNGEGSKAPSVFYPLGNNTDDWGDMKTSGYAGAVGDLGTVAASGSLVSDEWIGFGDKVDYKKFTLTSAAELSFTVNSLDKGPLKFTVCKLKSTTKKGVTTYSQVAIKSVTLKAGKASAAVKLLRLAAGDYYIKVETSSVKKSTGYEVQITHGDFYSDGDNGWNNVLLNKKALHENVQYFYDNELLGSEGAIHLDKADNDRESGDCAEFTYKGETYGGFVCFGDETDYAKLSLSGTEDVTFSLSATNDATLEIIKVTQNGTKYSQKSLKTAKFKAGTISAVATATVHLEAKENVTYYVSVKATNVKKTSVDPRMYYNVFYSIGAMEVSSALSMPETTDALAMTDSLGFGQYADASGIGALADLASQEFFRESETGILAGL